MLTQITLLKAPQARGAFAPNWVDSAAVCRPSITCRFTRQCGFTLALLKHMLTQQQIQLVILHRQAGIWKAAAARAATANEPSSKHIMPSQPAAIPIDGYSHKCCQSSPISLPASASLSDSLCQSTVRYPLPACHTSASLSNRPCQPVRHPLPACQQPWAKAALERQCALAHEQYCNEGHTIMASDAIWRPYGGHTEAILCNGAHTTYIPDDWALNEFQSETPVRAAFKPTALQLDFTIETLWSTQILWSAQTMSSQLAIT